MLVIMPLYVSDSSSPTVCVLTSESTNLGPQENAFRRMHSEEELSVFLPCSEDTGTSLSYGRLYTTPANSISVEILKTLVADV